MHARTIQLSFSGLSASVAPDGFSPGGYILEIGGAEQSHVDLAQPDYIFYEYLRRIGNVLDLLAPTGQPLAVAHLGAGALTLARYLQATRPGSPQVAVDIERELPSFVLQQLPLPAGSRCRVLIDDARAVLPRLSAELDGAALDAIIVDIFTGWDAPAHLTEEGFYRELADTLAPGGAVCVNVGDDPGLSFFTSQARTMLEVFEHVWCLTESSMLTGKNAGNLILVGTSHLLDEATQAVLTAAGPHPAAVLGTDQLVELIAKLEGAAD